MKGTEIIDMLKEIREETSNLNLPNAIQKIDYLIDDIYMYKQHSL